MSRATVNTPFPPAPTPARSLDGVARPNRQPLMPASVMKTPTARSARRWLFAGSMAVAAAVIVLGVIIWWRQYAVPPSGATELTQVERQVGRHFLLPAHDTPVLATVTDQTALNTPFLKQAKNDDKVLIYATGPKIAIIYRPSIDRIIAVGPVQIDTSQTNLQP